MPLPENLFLLLTTTGGIRQISMQTHTHTHINAHTCELVNFIFPLLLQKKAESTLLAFFSDYKSHDSYQHDFIRLRKSKNKNSTFPLYYLTTSSPEDLLVNVFLGPMHAFRWLSAWGQFGNKAISPTPQLLGDVGLLHPHY